MTRRRPRSRIIDPSSGSRRAVTAAIVQAEGYTGWKAKAAEHVVRLAQEYHVSHGAILGGATATNQRRYERNCKSYVMENMPTVEQLKAEAGESPPMRYGAMGLVGTVADKAYGFFLIPLILTALISVILQRLFNWLWDNWYHSTQFRDGR